MKSVLLLMSISLLSLLSVSAYAMDYDACVANIPKDATQLERQRAERECKSIQTAQELQQHLNEEMRKLSDNDILDIHLYYCGNIYRYLMSFGEVRFLDMITNPANYGKELVDARGYPISPLCFALFLDNVWNDVSSDRNRKITEFIKNYRNENPSHLELFEKNKDAIKFVAPLKNPASIPSIDGNVKISQMERFLDDKDAKIRQLQEEISKKDEIIKQKDAIIMEQVRVIVDLVSKIRTVLFQFF